MKRNYFSEICRRQVTLIAQLEKLIKRHGVIKEEISKLMVNIEKYGRWVAMHKAEYRCQRCGRSRFLQFHHLITRDKKNFMPFHDYMVRRHIYFNLMILCNECHDLVHNREGVSTKCDTISHDEILKIKSRFNYKDQ